MQKETFEKAKRVWAKLEAAKQMQLDYAVRDNDDKRLTKLKTNIQNLIQEYIFEIQEEFAGIQDEKKGFYHED